MSEKQKHSPLPWKAVKLAPDDSRHGVSAKTHAGHNCRIITCEHEGRSINLRFIPDLAVSKANAELVETAVNHHQDLVDMVESHLPFLDHMARGNEGEDRYNCDPAVCPLCVAKALLAKIKESEDA